MAYEIYHSTESSHLAIDKIIKLTVPGQELSLTQAIDLICEVLNVAIESVRVTKFDAKNPTDQHELTQSEKIEFYKNKFGNKTQFRGSDQ